MKKFILSAIFLLLVSPVFADTLTVYPDAGTGGTTCDGMIYRGATDETLGAIRSGAGNASDVTSAIAQVVSLDASGTTGQFRYMRRSMFTFDTTSIPTGDTIDSTVFSIKAQGAATTNLGDTTIEITSASPTSNNNLIASDYSNFGDTSFGSVLMSTIGTAAHTNISLSSDSISKGDITRLGARTGWDINNSYTGTWAAWSYTRINVYFADETGTTKDPKLVIEYSPAPAGNSLFYGSGL